MQRHAGHALHSARHLSPTAKAGHSVSCSARVLLAVGLYAAELSRVSISVDVLGSCAQCMAGLGISPSAVV
jgi:hypothetical protein